MCHLRKIKNLSIVVLEIKRYECKFFCIRRVSELNLCYKRITHLINITCSLNKGGIILIYSLESIQISYNNTFWIRSASRSTLNINIKIKNFNLISIGINCKNKSMNSQKLIWVTNKNLKRNNLRNLFLVKGCCLSNIIEIDKRESESLWAM